MKHMGQLDALRAFAVFAVFTNHWLPTRFAVLPWGSLGVQLFFLLSGFLITGILLDVRGKAESGAYPVSVGLRRFYARRFLRIFPLFYATLAVGFLIGLPNVRASLPWHALYASNFYVAFVNGSPGETSHFWTLAAEEQFYLVWPWVILLLPRRYLKPTFLGLMVVAVVWRFGGTALRISPFALQALPINTVDHFAFGAFLAYAQREEIEPRFVRVLRSRWLLAAAALAFVPSIALNLANVHDFWVGGMHVDPPVHWERLVVPTAAAVLFLNLLHHASQGIAGRPGRLLDSRSLRHAGKVSYGLYVLHLPLLAALAILLPYLGLTSIEPRSILWFPPKVALTTAVALLSWHLFEKPINGLKRHFPY